MMRKYQVRFGGGPTEKGSQDHLAGGLPNFLNLKDEWPIRCPTSCSGVMGVDDPAAGAGGR